MSRSLFDPLAADYDAARPGYPDALYDELPRLTRLSLAGARVVEVGAGTGKATAGLVARGARVLALDHGSAMLARLRTGLPGVAAALADAHRLPVRDGAAELVCYAQAWHWVEVATAAAEVARVLRPGGALAVWWNDVAAEGEPWWQAQQDRLEAASPGYRRDYRERSYAAELVGTGWFGPVYAASIGWHRELDLDGYETWLRSKSYVAALGAGLGDFLAAERASLAAAFPGGVVREPFRTTLYVCRRLG